VSTRDGGFRRRRILATNCIERNEGKEVVLRSQAVARTGKTGMQLYLIEAVQGYFALGGLDTFSLGYVLEE